MINLNNLILHDDVYDFSGNSEVTESVFTFTQSSMRSMAYLNEFHNAVTYELSPTNHIYHRIVYNFMNWLTDIGGLYGAVFAICLALIRVI